MSAFTASGPGYGAPDARGAGLGGAGETVLSRSARWKTPVILVTLALAAVVLFIGFGRSGTSPFTLSTASDFVQLPRLLVPARATSAAAAILLVLLALGSVLYGFRGRRTPLGLVIGYAVVGLVGFLVWADAGASQGITVPNLLYGSISLATPLIYGALGGVLSERAGVVNVAIEGQLLGGAFAAAMVASAVYSAVGGTAPTAGTAVVAQLVGFLAAAAAGVFVSFLLAVFGIKYLVEQVIVGVVLNVLISGLTSFFYTAVLSPNATVLNTPPRLTRLPIPGLSQIPVVGPALFSGTILIYLVYIAIVAVWFALYKTRWGLRVRAVGEHPKAADTVGINVNRKRSSTVLIAGAVAGFGGAFFTLGSSGAFTKDVTNGAGFIALAAVIFGQWNPIKAMLAALLFGFATNLQYVLQPINAPVPSDFMLMLPYLVTVLAVAGVVGRSRPPAADGVPYVTT